VALGTDSAEAPEDILRIPLEFAHRFIGEAKPMTSPSSLLAMMALIGLAVVELFTHLLPWA